MEEQSKHFHSTFEELSQQAEQAAAKAARGEALNTFGGAAGETLARGGPPKPPLRGVSGFVVAFWKEIGKDLGMTAKPS